MNNTRKHPWILQALCQYAGMLPPFPLLSGTAGHASSGFLRPVSALNEIHAMIPNFINNVQLLGKMTRPRSALNTWRGSSAAALLWELGICASRSSLARSLLIPLHLL